MKGPAAAVAFAAMLALLPVPVAAKQYLHPALKSKKRVVRSVLILPPQVEVHRISMKGSESLIREAGELADRLARLIASHLKDRQIATVPDPFSESALKHGEGLQETLTRIQRKYDMLAVQLHKRPKDVRKGRFSLGDEISTLPASASYDAVVFVRAVGRLPTAGITAAGAARDILTSVITGFPESSGTVPALQSYISLGDSRTGEILFIAQLVTVGDFMEVSDFRLVKDYGKALAEIPPASQK